MYSFRENQMLRKTMHGVVISVAILHMALAASAPTGNSSRIFVLYECLACY